MKQAISILYFAFFSIVFCNQSNYDYKIKLYGINVANCSVAYSDTILDKKDAIKIQYSVKTNKIINRLFKVNNNYTIILDSDSYNPLYYKKNTFQPGTINSIETEIIDKNIKYKNSNITINRSDKNIFSILSIIHNNDLNKLSDIELVEREGKYYYFKYNLVDGNKIKIDLSEVNIMNKGLIEHTDIFLWGLFNKKSNKTIIFNQDKKYIDECIFESGIIKITAKIIE
jgi:hypothetical protein